jgi:hypothetical protein
MEAAHQPTRVPGKLLKRSCYRIPRSGLVQLQISDNFT